MSCWYLHITATGKGRFPFDMLRFAQAYPASSADAAALDIDQNDREDLRRKRTITLACTCNTPSWGDCIVRRFASFGWTATITEQEYVA